MPKVACSSKARQIKNTRSSLTRALIACLAMSASCSDVIAQNIDALDIIYIAKITGYCGVIGSIVDFQATTKMPRGDEFLERFLSMEAARRGMRVTEIVDQCRRSVEAYDRFVKEIEQSEKTKSR